MPKGIVCSSYKVSILLGAQEDAAGEDVKTPPRLSHSLHLDPFHHICHIALSVPLANTSILLFPQDTAPGAEVNLPPRLSHSLQREPFHHLCQRASSVPFTKYLTC